MEYLRSSCDHDNLVKNISPETSTVRATINELFNRLTATGSLPLPDREKRCPKSVNEAAIQRKLGNDEFDVGNYVEALKFYTKSVAAAPHDSEEMALAYASRSAALFELKKYESCVVDINRASKKNYPDSFKDELYARKVACTSKIRAGDETTNCSERCGASGEAGERSASSSEFDEECAELNFTTRAPLPSANFNNKLIPNASEKIEINVADEIGKHWVATKDIQPGEILAIEKAYASVLSAEYRYTHCAQCYTRTESLIACNNCSSVMYCGERCREEALRLHHRIECELLPYLESLKNIKMNDEERLSLRILLIASEQGKELENMMTHPDYRDPFLESDIRRSMDGRKWDDYFIMHNLQGHREKEREICFTERAVILLHLLGRSSFFREDTKRKYEEPLSEKERYAGALLVKYLFNVSINCYYIAERVTNDTTANVEPLTEILGIGLAIYAFRSLINHSCDPNVMRRCHKDYMVTRSLQPIAAGEQITDQYIKRYDEIPLSERQNALKKLFFFECGCTPCRLNWPVFEKLPSKEPKYLSTDVDINELERYSAKFKNLPKIPSDENLNFLYEYVSLLYRSIDQPWKEYVEVLNCIRDLTGARGNSYSISNDDLILKFI